MYDILCVLVFCYGLLSGKLALGGFFMHYALRITHSPGNSRSHRMAGKGKGTKNFIFTRDTLLSKILLQKKF